MTKSAFISLTAIICLATSNLVFARDHGGYVAFGLGHSELTLNNVNYTSVGASIIVGAQVNRFFAAEVEYIDFGDLVDTTTNASVSSKSLSGVFLLPVSQHTSLYAKLGVTQVNTQLKGTGITGLTSTVSSQPYGIGVQYEASPTTTFRLFADQGYSSQANGTTTTLTTTNYNYSGDIRRIGFSTLYTF